MKTNIDKISSIQVLLQIWSRIGQWKIKHYYWDFNVLVTFISLPSKFSFLVPLDFHNYSVTVTTHTIFSVESYLLEPRRWIRSLITTVESPGLSFLSRDTWERCRKEDSHHSQEWDVCQSNVFWVLAFSVFCFFSFWNLSFSSQDFSSWILELLIITIASTITMFLLFFCTVFAFLILHACTSWTPSHLSNNFLRKLKQGHRAVLKQTRLWVTDSWSPGLSISRWQCIHICTWAKEYVPRLCALLWTQKTRMFLFVSSDPLCFEASGKKQGLFTKASKHHLFPLFLKSLKKN